jgi:hypothetical protein
VANEEWYDVKDDIYYIPTGWYESSEDEEATNFAIEYDVLGWQPLPTTPKGNKVEEI